MDVRTEVTPAPEGGGVGRIHAASAGREFQPQGLPLIILNVLELEQAVVALERRSKHVLSQSYGFRTIRSVPSAALR
ncbi:hypothetical protein SAMN00790413_06248 [Deinococcus hopiensis KR-140]|uniref:Uncharacterized protein n=1 Tax=Deinococcus hopiensis KR-140 TaxID=695939 RepID=A0A1W1VUG4_9DEIO|nr:hypothetical protein SAMN00790413_06248 [Deinococcus hopiensis KR-140]